MDIFFRHIMRSLVAVIAVAGLVFFVVYSLALEAGMDQLRQDADARLESVRKSLFIPIDKYSYLPQVVAGHPSIVRTLRGAGNAALAAEANRYLEELNRIAGADVIFLIDAGGMTVAASNWNAKSSFVGGNFAFRPYFQDAMRGEVGRFYGVGVISRVPGYYLSYPVVSGNAVIGVAVVKMELNHLDQGWADRRGYEVTISDEFGINFLSSVSDWRYRLMRPLTADEAGELQRTRKYDDMLTAPLPMRSVEQLDRDSRLIEIVPENFEKRDARHVSYLMRSEQLEYSDWNINVFMSTRPVRVRAVWLALLAVACPGLALFAFLYLRELRRRIDDRDRARRAIESAHADLGRKHQELQQLSEELHRAAITDPLTGSYNRRFFLEATTRLVSSAARHRFALSVIMIDIDHFKRINDDHGHHVGDLVLQRVTAICRDSLRGEDVFARFGGEEFVMALTHTHEAAALAIAERLRLNVMEHPVVEGGKSVPITISCGVAQHRPIELSIEAAIRRADAALYAAKHAGRNQVTSHAAQANALPAQAENQGA